MHLSRIWLLGILAAGCLSVALTQGLPGAQSPPQPARVRIGTYNTRAVALAYGRSDEHNRYSDKRYKE